MVDKIGEFVRSENIYVAFDLAGTNRKKTCDAKLMLKKFIGVRESRMSEARVTSTVLLQRSHNHN